MALRRWPCTRLMFLDQAMLVAQLQISVTDFTNGATGPCEDSLEWVRVSQPESWVRTDLGMMTHNDGSQLTQIS
eukprot:3544910-Karenia_brevis.AAC.1